MKVQEKWGFLLDLVSAPEARAALMAIITSWLRIMYDRKESAWQRVGLESLLCGAVSYGISSGLSALGAEPGLAVFAGASVGFLGADFVRIQARKLVRRKVDATSGTDTQD